jgi:hypothetical protein
MSQSQCSSGSFLAHTYHLTVIVWPAWKVSFPSGKVMGALVTPHPIGPFAKAYVVNDGSE